MSSKDLMLKISKQTHVCTGLCCYPHCFILVNITTKKPSRLMIRTCLHGMRMGASCNGECTR